MRVARFLSGLAVVTFLTALPPARPATAHASDSLAPSDPTPAPPRSDFAIRTERGEWIRAVYVGSWSMGMVRYRTTTDKTGYLPASRILSIEDAEGHDVLGEILRKRSSFGSPSPAWHQTLAERLATPFRSPPERVRRGFFVSEIGMSARADDGPTTGDRLVTAGLGGMRNLSRNWALGGVASFSMGGGDYRCVSGGVRARRYLNDTFALETTHGLFSDGTAFDERRNRALPYFGEIALSAAGVYSLFVRVEQHHYVTSTQAAFYGVDTSEYSDTAWHIGLRLGPRPGYLTTPGAALVAIAYLSRMNEHVIY